MKVTISDVAKMAGVSTATVSHTINHTRYVAPETCERVQEAIHALGYTPDASARSFRTGKKKTIGFIVPDISNRFFATLVESVEQYLSSQDYHLIIANTHEDMEREETCLRLLSAGLVDGLLVASTLDRFPRFQAALPPGFPVVLVDRVFEEKKYASVSVSNFQPIYRSVCRLAGKGDRRVGFIGGPARLSTTQERLSAYTQAVSDCGLTADPALICYGNFARGSTVACLDSLLAQQCDGILVANGLMAVETIMYLQRKGIQIGREIDLVSFLDYHSDFYQLYSDAMDCIVQPVEELGAAAGDAILKRILSPEMPIVESVLTSGYKPHSFPQSMNHSQR